MLTTPHTKYFYWAFFFLSFPSGTPITHTLIRLLEVVLRITYVPFIKPNFIFLFAFHFKYILLLCFWVYSFFFFCNIISAFFFHLRLFFIYLNFSFGLFKMVFYELHKILYIQNKCSVITVLMFFSANFNISVSVFGRFWLIILIMICVFLTLSWVL